MIYGFLWRRAGLVVSLLDSESSGLGSSPGRGHCVVSLERHFTPTVPLSTQVYKWVPAYFIAGVTLRCPHGLAYYSGRSRNTQSRFMQQELEISTSLMSHLARMQTVPVSWDTSLVRSSIMAVKHSSTMSSCI